MTGEPRRRLSIRCRAALLLLVTTLVAGELAVHTLVAKAYYDLNARRLQLIAVMAVRAGVAHLPEDRSLAVWIADSCARSNGVTHDEIVFIRASSDDQILTIRLDRRIPQYLSLFIVGLPSRDITVIASARSLAVSSRRYMTSL